MRSALIGSVTEYALHRIEHGVDAEAAGDALTRRGGKPRAQCTVGEQAIDRGATSL
jgi:hypothetical protein